jgi:hypothetical protein
MADVSMIVCPIVALGRWLGPCNVSPIYNRARKCAPDNSSQKCCLAFLRAACQLRARYEQSCRHSWPSWMLFKPWPPDTESISRPPGSSQPRPFWWGYTDPMEVPRHLGIYRSKLTGLRAVVLGEYRHVNAQDAGYIMGHEDLSRWGIALRFGFWSEYVDTGETWFNTPPTAGQEPSAHP